MKILLYGENWEGTHVNIVSRILKEKNIDCKVFDFFSILSYNTKVVLANRILRRLFYFRNEPLINRRLLAEIDNYKPDILLISKGVNIYPETLQAFKNKGIQVINWNQDDFFNKLNSSRHLEASRGIYDYVLSPRPQMFDAYLAAGIKKIAFIESYYVPWLHKKPAKIPVQERKILFVGSHSQRRERIIDNIDSPHPIEIWGAGWSRSSLQKKSTIDIKNRIMGHADFPEHMSKNLLNLNILTVENNDLTNLKVFEITACYGLLLTDYNAYTESILTDGAYYYPSGAAKELNERIAYIFEPANAELINEAREKGYQTIINGHNSINDRVDQVLQILNGDTSFFYQPEAK